MKILRFVFQKLTLEIFLNSNYGILQKIKLFYGTWSLESGLQNDHLKFIGQRYSKFNSFFLPVTIFIVSLNYFFFPFHQGGLSLPHSQNRKPISTSLLQIICKEKFKSRNHFRSYLHIHKTSFNNSMVPQSFMRLR